MIAAVIAQIFIPNAELVIPTGKKPNEGNVEIEKQPVTVAAKISKCSPVFIFHSLNHYLLFLLKDNFLFHLFF